MQQVTAHLDRSEIVGRAQLRSFVRLQVGRVEPSARHATAAFLLTLHGQRPPSHLVDWVHPALLYALEPWLEAAAAPAAAPAPLEVEAPVGLADCAVIALAGGRLYTVMWRMEATARTQNLTRLFWEAIQVSWERR